MSVTPWLQTEISVCRQSRCQEHVIDYHSFKQTLLFLALTSFQCDALLYQKNLVKMAVNSKASPML